MNSDYSDGTRPGYGPRCGPGVSDGRPLSGDRAHPAGSVRIWGPGPSGGSVRIRETGPIRGGRIPGSGPFAAGRSASGGLGCLRRGWSASGGLGDCGGVGPHPGGRVVCGGGRLVRETGAHPAGTPAAEEAPEL
ncbi:hypothetical protein GCM10022226_67690 [Sphaerisporangium flaviroseum]|uniref:Uncharacterized protein n=1 Tax=Sphaerisporangium flaviroseum TaxID=509199 RepID=A0ABP7J7V6_9ACTN